jgi:hypothetical protein
MSHIMLMTALATFWGCTTLCRLCTCVSAAAAAAAGAAVPGALQRHFTYQELDAPSTRRGPRLAPSVIEEVHIAAHLMMMMMMMMMMMLFVMSILLSFVMRHLHQAAEMSMSGCSHVGVVAM